MVPPDTPGMTFAAPIANPFRKRTRYDFMGAKLKKNEQEVEVASSTAQLSCSLVLLE
jgi:hypothetical protein